MVALISEGPICPIPVAVTQGACFAGLESAMELAIVYAERMAQVDEDTIKGSSVQWGDLLADVLLPYPVPISWGVPVNLYTGLHARLSAHFEEVEYPPPTGDECPEVTARGSSHGGYGGCEKGSGGYGDDGTD